jgi:hypothetical protein
LRIRNEIFKAKGQEVPTQDSKEKTIPKMNHCDSRYTIITARRHLREIDAA